MTKLPDLETVSDEAELDIQQPNSTDSKTSETEEIGGPKGPEPTRYGDWERKGRCIDF